ncbi:thioesterase family protein [Amylibacter sp. IMCC11727]|uniref:acyl-CoA thioesterase n=1 Tax=Amylibacter sp. IMCC11727 TaxID=3039851 RepID=UPI00244DA91C|nr:thioesterase family protein [Amylibacter sp. IMCC11727]WGI22181.1 thioesterase family protein [Amylibacter sp. IMCC11727]
MTDLVFDTAIALTETAPGEWSGQSSPDYANMVGAYGGIVAATLLNSVLSDSRGAGTPVSQTVNFCTGLGAGAFRITTKLQRAGKYIQHWSTELTQGDTIIATSSVVMGNRSETFSHQPAPMPDVPPAQDITPMGNIIPLQWTNRYDYRFVNGGPEGLGTPRETLGDSQTRVWLADAPRRPLDYLSLAALADCFFLRLIQIRGTMEPMGTVTLTTHFLATPDDLARQGESHLLGVVDANRMHNQFHDQTMQLFSTDGKILASGTQLVWYRQ